MHFLGAIQRSGAFDPCRATVIALMLGMGCASPDASMYGSSAFASNHVECNQTDSTVTCCLKQNPGQYERCGATPPTRSAPINRGPPGIKSQEAAEPGESKNKRRASCLPDYVACIDKIGQKPGGVSGTSQCQDCYDYCVGNGFWPVRMNKKPCPGAGR